MKSFLFILILTSTTFAAKPPQAPMPPQAPPCRSCGPIIMLKTCPCSGLCECGCNEGQECRCGNPPLSKPVVRYAQPQTQPQSPTLFNQQEFSPVRQRGGRMRGAGGGSC